MAAGLWKRVIQTFGNKGGKSFCLKTTLETYFIYKHHLTQLPLQNISLLHLALSLPSTSPQSILYQLLPKFAVPNSALQSILSPIHFTTVPDQPSKMLYFFFLVLPCPKNYHRATPGCSKKCLSIRAKNKGSVPRSTSYQWSEFTVVCGLMIELHSEPCIIKQFQHHVNTTQWTSHTWIGVPTTHLGYITILWNHCGICGLPLSKEFWGTWVYWALTFLSLNVLLQIGDRVSFGRYYK